MPLVRGSVVTDANTDSQLASVTAPTGLAAGDLVILWAEHYPQNGVTITPPSGFTQAFHQQGGEVQCALFWKVADGTETDFEVDYGATMDYNSLLCVAYVDAEWDVEPTHLNADGGTGGGQPVPIPDIPAGDTDRTLIGGAIIENTGSAFSPPAGWTELYDAIPGWTQTLAAMNQASGNAATNLTFTADYPNEYVSWSGAIMTTEVVEPPNLGDATGTHAWSGSASGDAPEVPANEGATTGAHAWSGSASGVTPAADSRTGAATAAHTWSGSALGSAPAVRHTGEGLGAHTWEGFAAGPWENYPGTSVIPQPIPFTIGVTVTEKSGSASGTYVFPGGATGAHELDGEVTGTWRLLVVAAWGTATHSGATTGAFGWAGTTTGEKPPAGVANGSASWACAAQGERPAAGDGAAVVAWAGSATGITPVVPPVFGSATAAHTWEAAASGARQPKASSTGTNSYPGTATGQRPSYGQAIGAHAWATQEVTGERPPAGHGHGAYGFARASATGKRPNRGEGVGVPYEWHFWAATGETHRAGESTGTHGWAATTTGVFPASGSATGTHAWAPSPATGERDSYGPTDDGTVHWTSLPATGEHQPAGDTTGTYTWAGAAAGRMVTHGDAQGVRAWTGTGAGRAPYFGYAVTPEHLWVTAAAGARASLGEAQAVQYWTAGAGGDNGEFNYRSIGGRLTDRHSHGELAATPHAHAVLAPDDERQVFNRVLGVYAYVGGAAGVAARTGEAAGVVTHDGAAAGAMRAHGDGSGGHTWPGGGSGEAPPDVSYATPWATEDFDGLGDGDPITTTNTNLAFTDVDGTLEADTAHAVTGSVSARVETTVDGALVIMRLDYPQTKKVCVRAYFRPGFTPSTGGEGETNIMEIRNTWNTILGMLEWQETGHIGIKDGNSLTASSTSIVPVGEWTRIEWLLDEDADQMWCRLFIGANANGHTPDEEFTGDFFEFSGRDLEHVWFGQVRKTFILESWWDGLAAGPDWLGPAT